MSFCWYSLFNSLLRSSPLRHQPFFYSTGHILALVFFVEGAGAIISHRDLRTELKPLSCETAIIFYQHWDLNPPRRGWRVHFLVTVLWDISSTTISLQFDVSMDMSYIFCCWFSLAAWSLGERTERFLLTRNFLEKYFWAGRFKDHYAFTYLIKYCWYETAKYLNHFTLEHDWR